MALYETLEKLPLLQYLKEPVNTISDLYNRYPDGGEYGWYAFVYSENTFYYFNKERKDWLPLQPRKLQEILGIAPVDLTNGDTIVWNEEEGKFEKINMSLIGTNEY